MFNYSGFVTERVQILKAQFTFHGNNTCFHKKTVHKNDDGVVYEQTAINAILLQLVKDMKAEMDELKAQIDGLKTEMTVNCIKM